MAFRILTITGLFKPSKLANCQEDSDVSILLDNSLAASKQQEKKVEINRSPYSDNSANDLDKNTVNDRDSSETYGTPANINNTNSTLEENAIAYYAGYLIKKVKIKFNCSKCFVSNSEPFKSNLAYTFLLEKNYGSCSEMCLEVPSDDIRAFVHRIYLTSRNFFDEYVHIDSLGINLKNKIIKENLLWLGNKDDTMLQAQIILY